MGTARYSLGGLGNSGSQTSALGFGGTNSGLPGMQSATEEWNGAQATTKTVTVT